MRTLTILSEHFDAPLDCGDWHEYQRPDGARLAVVDSDDWPVALGIVRGACEPAWGIVVNEAELVETVKAFFAVRVMGTADGVVVVMDWQA